MERPETIAKLQQLVTMVAAWNSVVNLVSDDRTEVLQKRHVADSLQIARALPKTGAVADFGSGAGFPGLVIALVRSNPICVIEADRRKAAFLIEASRQLELPQVQVICDRVERLAPLRADIVTARAFAHLRTLMGYAHRHLASNGVLVAPKGITAETELHEAQQQWHMRVERFPSQTHPQSTIFRLSEISPRNVQRK